MAMIATAGALLRVQHKLTSYTQLLGAETACCTPPVTLSHTHTKRDNETKGGSVYRELSSDPPDIRAERGRAGLARMHLPGPGRR